MTESLISRIEQHVRDLINELANTINGDFLPSVKDSLKFEHESDWMTICSVLDIIGDTELAKSNFREFKIEGPTKIQNYGERYLRLYGILNAVYLQHSAIKSFLEVIKFPGKTSALKEFNQLKILELRNKAGAHTVDYLENRGEKKPKKNPLQISRGLRDDSKIVILDSKNIYHEYDLITLLDDFDDTVENLLLKGSIKFISTVFKNNEKNRNRYLDRLNRYQQARKTGILMGNGFDDEPLFVDLRKKH
ncbi:hypothetical protein [Algoriphagus formosus]|uniref:hypothetical protein n=1 Tax=Algoriphagus formosus TaxID=2007308 RepID=UPI000C284EFC|nr:hypothetical protein [Algoriphagus formosus]